MAIATDVASQPRIFFTAPWDPVVVRRGDALGLRALADEFAEAVAPGLSNRVHDGRWVTILAWCLVQSHKVFHGKSGRPVTTAVEQRHRYAWLRPLELMWVARTIAISGDQTSNRSMSGQRRVAPWYQDFKNAPHRAAICFGMSEDQFRAYRQTGMYGGYRIAFRRWPGLTQNGDGWTPGPMAHNLAKWLDKQLGKNALPTLNKSSAPRVGKGEEHNWWLRHWASFDHKGKDFDVSTLPRQKDDFTKLPEKEANLLAPLMFGSNEQDEDCQRRRKIAQAVAKSSGNTHIEICEYLSQTFSDDPVIPYLARFSRLADAGMEAMDLIARSLTKSSSIALKEVASAPDASMICDELHAAALDWLIGVKRAPVISGMTHVDRATNFARTLTSAEPKECLKALLKYHADNGGGLMWFVLSGEQIEPRSIPAANKAAPYRFRLWSLCRLAVQCGVIRTMPRGLKSEVPESDDDEE